MTKDHINLVNIKGESMHEYQKCYMPMELMKKLKITLQGAINIDIGGRALVCKVYPTFELPCDNDCFEVYASYHMIHNISHIKDFLCERKLQIEIKNITTLNVLDISEVNISVITSSLDDAFKIKKYVKEVAYDVQTILKSYLILNNSIVCCISNPVAKLMGITYIIINNFIPTTSKESEDIKYAGKTTFKTKIIFKQIESEERHFGMMEHKTLLGGLDTVLEDLKRLITDRWRTKIRNSSSGVLLIGPPGCGKSSLVRMLCYQTQACFVSTAGAELQSSYEGETLQNFEKVAKKACSMSREGPCIFFIDEIDSIGIALTKELSAEDVELTNQALSILDECKKYPYLLVMAATNRPFVLAKSIRTSGRFELEVLLSAPTLNERKCILKIYCKDLLPEAHPSLSEIASATPGFVGADLKFLCEKVREKYANELTLKKPLCPSVVCNEMLSLCSTMSPSIHKSLEFITRKPIASPVGGLNHVQQQLDLLLSKHLKYKKHYKLFKLKKPKGILFYGPHGCGKTSLVSLLASQRGFSFISATSSHLLSPYVGESERRVAALFHSARLAQPSIIFLDEIDGIFGSRETASKGVRINILTELLQAMDGADIEATSRQGSSRIKNEITVIQDDSLVCAATNHPQKLDSALLRPGRFDYLIYVPPPDLEARMDILKLKTSKIKIDEHLLREISIKTDKWTGAELDNLISTVTLQAIFSENCIEFTGKIFITEDLLWKEFEKFSPSLLKKDLKAFKNFDKNIS